MDTSRQYVNMCRAAREIQESWPLTAWEKDSWFSDGDGIFNALERRVCSDSVWLCRQDQLQEMMGLPIDTLWNDFSVWVEVRVIAGNGDYRLREYKSFEQLWLAFVMANKFNKEWDGSDWVPTPS